MKKLILSIVLSVFYTTGPINIFAQDIEYAQHLFTQQDYYRSISEWKKIEYYSDNQTEKAHARLMISRCYYKAGLYNDAIQQAASFLQINTQNYEEQQQAYEIIALSYYRLHNFVMADQYIARTTRDADTTSATIEGLEVMLLLISSEYEAALKRLQNTKGILPETITDKAITILQTELPLKTKSPLISGSLSALIPGTGQIYSKHPVDGIQAFLMNLSMGLATVGLFLFEQETDIPHFGSGVSACLTGGFYAANIYGASKTAAYYTLRQKQDLIRQCEKILIE